MMMKSMRGIQLNGGIIFLAILAVLAVTAASAAEMTAGSKVERAVAVLHPTEGSRVTGMVVFTQVGNKVRVEGMVEGLTPGKHGFHIHEWGDCSAPDGSFAGGHYNPDNNPHAGPDQMKRHMGDLGNLDANSTGEADYERVDGYVTLNGPHSVIGRAIIVHAGQDDLTSQPTGNAGGRVACGVIGISHE
jgi:superoxide dismutase, Cu-Zn family